MQGHPGVGEPLENGIDVRNPDLDVKSSTERPLERCFVDVEGSPQTDLVNHQLSVSEHKIAEPFLRALVEDGEADQLAVEPPACLPV